jgi:nucleotide-binding universal stress UspA family protein
MKILIAIDGSIYSQQAVQEVAQRPWPAGSAARVISVIKLPFVPTAETRSLPESDYSRLERELQTQAERAVEATLRQLADARTVAGEPLALSSAILLGHPSRMLLTEADRWGADLIVLGPRGLGGFKRFVLGSVSQAIAQGAKCSVLIARSSASDKNAPGSLA